MSAYNITYEAPDVLRLSFGQPASGEDIVQAAENALDKLDLSGGVMIKLNGAVTVATAVMLGHKLSSLYATIAVWDPKLGHYIVVVCQNSNYCIGELI